MSSLLPLPPPAGEGADPFTSFNAWEYGPSALSEQHSGVDPIEGTGESSLRM